MRLGGCGLAGHLVLQLNLGTARPRVASATLVLLPLALTRRISGCEKQGGHQGARPGGEEAKGRHRAQGARVQAHTPHAYTLRPRPWSTILPVLHPPPGHLRGGAHDVSIHCHQRPCMCAAVRPLIFCCLASRRLSCSRSGEHAARINRHGCMACSLRHHHP